MLFVVQFFFVYPECFENFFVNKAKQSQNIAFYINLLELFYASHIIQRTPSLRLIQRAKELKHTKKKTKLLKFKINLSKQLTL